MFWRRKKTPEVENYQGGAANETSQAKTEE
jgi:hypothetical protein